MKRPLPGLPIRSPNLREIDVSDDWLDVVEGRLQNLHNEVQKRDSQSRKTLDEVFDESTLLILYKLISNGLLETIDYPVSTGKEANVFHATARGGGSLAVKIFRVNTATFRSFMTYIHGDPRFQSVRQQRRDIVYAWTQKEYKNLQRMQQAEVRVPNALAYHSNVLVMDFIGDQGTPAPLVKDRPPSDPRAAYEDVCENYRRMYRGASLVHGDLSEFNILNLNEELFIIDVAQSVLTRHPMRDELLTRDAKNLTRWFRKLGVKTTPEETLAAMKGPDPVADEEPEDEDFEDEDYEDEDDEGEEEEQ